MKQVEVTILGQGYILGCPPGGEALLSQAVARVDQEMSAIRDGGKVKARERIAVLAALNLAYQLAEGPGAAAGGASSGLPAAAAASAGGAFDEQVDALVKRLDTALGSDGHLI